MNAQGGPSIPHAPAALDVVVDTNVALDGLLFHNPRVNALMQALRAGRLRWIACAAMRDELGRMLAHPRLQGWSPDVEGAMTQFDALSTSVPTPPRSWALRCTDTDDQVFLDLSLAHGARWLFTQDRALLKLARRTRRLGFDVVTPQDWLGP